MSSACGGHSSVDGFGGRGFSRSQASARKRESPRPLFLECPDRLENPIASTRARSVPTAAAIRAVTLPLRGRLGENNPRDNFFRDSSRRHAFPLSASANDIDSGSSEATRDRRSASS
jgi:hypothetical protein